MAKDANNPNNDGSGNNGFPVSLEDLNDVPGMKGIKGAAQTGDQGGSGGTGDQGTGGGAAGNQDAGSAQGAGANPPQGQQGQDGNADDKPKAVEIDKVEYKLDDKGNALNQDGTVFKTADEIKKMLDDQEADDTPLIDSYQKMTGFTAKGDDGKPKVYTDDEEGFVQYNKDYAIHLANQAFEQRLNQHPDFKKYYEYVARGGNPAEYHKQQANSWKNIKFDAKNIDLLKNIVVAQLKGAGMSDERAKLTAKMYEDTAALEAAGKEAYDVLVASETEREKAEQKTYEARAEQQKEAERKYWNDVEGKIKAGKLSTITVPDNERPEFIKYMSLAINKEGDSQADLDESAMSLEQWLEWRYIMLYKKGDLSKLVKTKADTLRTHSLKSRLAGRQEGLGDGRGADTRRASGNTTLDNISLDSVIDGNKGK